MRTLRAGFTLFEAIVTTAVSAVAIIGITAALIGQLRGIEHNRQWVTVHQAASRQLEALRLEPFANLPALHNTAFPPPDGLNALPGAQGRIYVAQLGDPNLVRITVVVILDGRSWRLTTLRAAPS